MSALNGTSPAPVNGSDNLATEKCWSNNKRPCQLVIVNKLHCKKEVGRWSADHLPTTYQPPTDHLPTTYGPSTDHLRTTYRPPTDHLRNTYMYRPPVRCDLKCRCDSCLLMLVLHPKHLTKNMQCLVTFNIICCHNKENCKVRRKETLLATGRKRELQMNMLKCAHHSKARALSYCHVTQGARDFLRQELQSGNTQ